MTTRKRLMAMGATAALGIVLAIPAVDAATDNHSPQINEPARTASVPTEVTHTPTTHSDQHPGSTTKMPSPVHDQSTGVTPDQISDANEHRAGHDTTTTVHDTVAPTTTTVPHDRDMDHDHFDGPNDDHNEPGDHAEGEHHG